MNLKNLMLSEKRHSFWFHLYEILEKANYRHGKEIGGCLQLNGEAEIGCRCGHNGNFWCDISALILNWGGSCTTV